MNQQNFNYKKAAQKLESWFQKNKRDLEWRNNLSPYRVWVSEIMLQQTRVNTVAEYYKKWMQKFPTIEKLAQADLPQVLKVWEGLGYYRRCKNLWETAQFIVKNYQGKIPDSEEKLLNLAGIGKYSAAAICSLAYNQKIPAIDGNVRRVLSRLYCYETEIEKAAATTFFSSTVQKFIQYQSSNIINQALMELGAIVCNQSPQCEICPLSSCCLAYNSNQVLQFPKIKTRIKITPLTMHYWAIQNLEGKFLLCRQNSEQWWQGMWVFPHLFEHKDRSLKSMLVTKNLVATKTKKLQANFPEEIEKPLIQTKNRQAQNKQAQNKQAKKIGSLLHYVTKYKIQVNFWSFLVPQKIFHSPKTAWFSKSELNQISLPKASKSFKELLIKS